jgi:hypothetical protein
MGQQIWAVSSLGGYLSNNVLSKQIRHSAQPLMKFRQFVDAEAAAGKNRGDKVLFNKRSRIFDDHLSIRDRNGTLNGCIK